MKKAAIIFAALMAIGLGGCKKQTIIDHVSVVPSDDLMNMSLSLVFADNIQTTMSGDITTPYGNFFMIPYATTQPFEIGFNLDMSIFYDQEYVGLTPTTMLPNGTPIGIPYPVIEIKKPTPIHEKFDIYGYVDIGHYSWIGVAAIFSFMNDKYFPAGLSVSQVFLRNDLGQPAILASVFGPTLNPDNTIKVAGGISVFANVKQLIEEYGAEPMNFKAEHRAKAIGPNAGRLRNPGEWRRIESKLVEGFNLH
ncbi:MAG: hypothetical protein A2583_05840 [Bdellovibrionales bacterium RIFOXYD1_FULL_53_11]|nr:MAG: hypothetical protein A2583_05840 [Bdellovibrionales bacterium RIFOXYD1_FULL_53_11]